MELKQYWNVIWKRRWLVLAIFLLTAALSAAMFLTSKLSYQADTKFNTRQEPVAGSPTSLFLYQPYGYWIGSEFLVDDYTQIVQSDAFATSVWTVLKNEPNEPNEASEPTLFGKPISEVTTDDIKSSLEADRRQRQLHVQITGSSREEALKIAGAVATVLTESRLKPIKGQDFDDRPVFSQIDEATADEVTSSRSKELLNAIIRVIVGLVVALALVFLLEYLDGSVRDERDAQKVLDLPVLGAIPRI